MLVSVIELSVIFFFSIPIAIILYSGVRVFQKWRERQLPMGSYRFSQGVKALGR